MFNEGDIVSVNNGVCVNGTPLSEIPAQVEKVTSEFLFLQFKNFKYVANIKDCKLLRR